MHLMSKLSVHTAIGTPSSSRHLPVGRLPSRRWLTPKRSLNIISNHVYTSSGTGLAQGAADSCIISQAAGCGPI